MAYLQTPGTCVVDIASGQTSQTEGGGFHRFHDNVHTGTAGLALAATGQVTRQVHHGRVPVAS